jgi:hypothetical protein
MSNAIQLQADIGGLGIQGLGAFSTVLSTLSADNVTPMAMVQMESLGALFHVNGPFAEQVPDMLKRFSSQPLGRLAVSVGWRRGDSASLMADSSGGQAIALLSLCLTNLFPADNVAMILHKICSRVLAKAINIASMAQLGAVANILGGKLQTLGFGNYLAQRVMKVHSVYEQLGARLPNDILSPLTDEAVVDLLECLKCVFSENSAILRVTGLTGMGYILALVLFMFPNDTLVTAESFILHEGSSAKKRIILELSQVATGPLRARVETELKTEPVVELPIAAAVNSPPNTCSFSWRGWMARCLQLNFSAFGAICSEELRIACCDLLIAVAPEIGRKSYDKKRLNLPRDGLEAMLGEYPMHRMERVCEEILLVRPSATRMTVLSSFSVVACIFSDLTKDISCCCHVMCDFKRGWTDEGFNAKCLRRKLWKYFGSSLGKGLGSFLINAGPNTAISPINSSSGNFVTEFIDRTLGSQNYRITSSKEFYSQILNILNYQWKGNLARSSSSTTIYATVLKSLRIPPSLLRTFELVDGQLIYDGRYHTNLDEDQSTENRPRAARSIVSRPKSVEPSNIGQHTDLSITIFEKVSGLTMKATAQCAGMNLNFALSSIIGAFFGLAATDKCSHPPSSPLNKALNGRVMITSVASPRPDGTKIGLVMTQSNPTAQFLSCEEGVQALLLRDCCLNCAFQQAKEGYFRMIIVV